MRPPPLPCLPALQGYSIPMAAQLDKLHGALTPQNIISDIAGVVQTGDVHAAVYDLTDQQLYVSFMAHTNGTGPMMAYDRAWTQLDLISLFALPPP
jgi:isopenicillin-N N-acyltransferase-like protein